MGMLQRCLLFVAGLACSGLWASAGGSDRRGCSSRDGYRISFRGVRSTPPKSKNAAFELLEADFKAFVSEINLGVDLTWY